MRELIEYLPPHIAADPEVQRVQEALTVVMRRCWAAWEDLLLQTHPQTATWSLPYWERKYGIVSDPTLSIEARRAVLLGHMRSAGTATAEALANVASALAGREAVVLEYNDKGRFEVRLFDDKELPVTWEELIRAVCAVAPAHLGLEVWVHIRRVFRQSVTVASGGATGGSFNAPPPRVARRVSSPLHVAQGAYLTSRPAGPESGGVFYHTHIKSKLIR